MRGRAAKSANGSPLRLLKSQVAVNHHVAAFGQVVFGKAEQWRKHLRDTSRPKEANAR